MRRFLTLFIFGLCFWTSNLFAIGDRRNSTGTRLDTVWFGGEALDSLALKIADADSIGYWKFLQGQKIESTFVVFTTDKQREGVFSRAFRASDASGTVGSYSILALPFNNGNRSTYTYANPVWLHYNVTTDPPGDVDTSDVSLAAVVSTNNDKTGYTLTAADKQALRDTIFNLMVNNEQNLVANPSFERSEGGSIVGWRTVTGNGSQATIAAKTGKYGMVVRGSGAAFGVVRSDSIRLSRGQQVTLGVKFKDVPTAAATVTLYDSLNNTIISLGVTTSNHWNSRFGTARLSTSHFGGASSGLCFIDLESGTIGANDSLYVDDVFLIPSDIYDAVIDANVMGTGAQEVASHVGDTVAILTNQDPDNLVHDPGFEGFAAQKVWHRTINFAIVNNGSIKMGRKVGRLAGTANVDVVSDTFRIEQGQRVFFGADILTSDVAGGADGAFIGIQTVSGTDRVTIPATYFDKWQHLQGYYKASAADEDVVFFIQNGANVADTTRIDNCFVKLTSDSLTPLIASDNIGINWGDITNPTATQGLSGTQVHVYDTDTSGNMGSLATWIPIEDNDSLIVDKSTFSTARIHTFKEDTIQARTFPTDTIKTVTDPIAATAVIPDIDNLVRNPHFETGSGALPQPGWQAIGGGSSISTLLPNSGTKALRKFGITGGALSDSIYLTAGSNVTIEGRVYTSHVATTSINLLKAGTSIPDLTTPARVANQWHTITTSGRIDFDGFYNLFCSGPSNVGTDSAWFDDVAVRAFPDTIGSATTQQAIIPGTFIDTIFTRNMTIGSAVPNVTVLIRTLAGADWGQIITGTNGKKAVGFNAGTYLLYPGFAGGVSWRNTDNPDTFVVTGNGQTDTIRGDTFSPSTPPDPNLCTVFGWISHQGKPLAGATVRFSLVGDTLKVGNWLVVNKDRDTLTNAAGYFEIPLLINSLITPANTRYTMSIIDAFNVEVRRIENLVIPNQASFEVNR